MRKDRFIVYVIKSSKCDDVYIGITSQSIRMRWNQHKHYSKKSNTKLYAAMRQFGVDSFTIEPVMCCFSYHALRHYECLLIAQFDSIENGLNSTIGGAGSPGCIWPEKGRQKMRDNTVRHWADPEYRNRISKAQKEAWARKSPQLVEEHRKRASETGKRVMAARPPRERKKPMLGPPKPQGLNMTVKTHCPRGHPYDNANTRYSPSGARICFTCKSERQRRFRLAIKTASGQCTAYAITTGKRCSCTAKYDLDVNGNATKCGNHRSILDVAPTTNARKTE